MTPDATGCSGPSCCSFAERLSRLRRGWATRALTRSSTSGPTVRSMKDRAAAGGVYLTAELIIWYFRALAAGDTGSVAPETVLLRSAERTK